MANNFDLELKEIQLQNEKLSRSVTEILKFLEHPEERKAMDKEFYTIEDCALLKGGAALNTFKANRFYLPGCGNPKFDCYVAGKLCFQKKEVLKWLKYSDADYAEYAKECGIPVVPEKYERMARRARGELACAG